MSPTWATPVIVGVHSLAVCVCHVNTLLVSCQHVLTKPRYVQHVLTVSHGAWHLQLARHQAEAPLQLLHQPQTVVIDPMPCDYMGRFSHDVSSRPSHPSPPKFRHTSTTTCNMEHGNQESARETDEVLKQQQQDLHPSHALRLCQAYASSGTCKEGLNCAALHPDSCLAPYHACQPGEAAHTDGQLWHEVSGSDGAKVLVLFLASLQDYALHCTYCIKSSAWQGNLWESWHC